MSAAKQVGDRVGPYQLIGVLGVGGAGQVFRALWDPTEEERPDAPPDHPPEVALKLLLPSAAANEAIFRRFVREIVVAQQIRHPTSCGSSTRGSRGTCSITRWRSPHTARSAR